MKQIGNVSVIHFETQLQEAFVPNVQDNQDFLQHLFER